MKMWNIFYILVALSFAFLSFDLYVDHNLCWKSSNKYIYSKSSIGDIFYFPNWLFDLTSTTLEVFLSTDVVDLNKLQKMCIK